MFRRNLLGKSPLPDARVVNPRVLSAATAVPPHRVEQGDIKEFARQLFAGKFRDLDRLLPIFDNGHSPYAAHSVSCLTDASF